MLLKRLISTPSWVASMSMVVLVLTIMQVAISGDAIAHPSAEVVASNPVRFGNVKRNYRLLFPFCCTVYVLPSPRPPEAFPTGDT